LQVNIQCAISQPLTQHMLIAKKYIKTNIDALPSSLIYSNVSIN
jgi:hypothetical protein